MKKETINTDVLQHGLQQAADLLDLYTGTFVPKAPNEEEAKILDREVRACVGLLMDLGADIYRCGPYHAVEYLGFSAMASAELDEARARGELKEEYGDEIQYLPA